MCLPRVPLPVGRFLTHSHIWSNPGGSDGRSPTRRVLPGDVFSEASLEAGSRHPAFHVVSRQRLGRVRALTLQKGLLFPLTTCGLRCTVTGTTC